MGKVNGRRCVRVFLGGNGGGGRGEGWGNFGVGGGKRTEGRNVNRGRGGRIFLREIPPPPFFTQKSNGILAKHPKKVVLLTN